METYFLTITDWMTGTMAFAVLGSFLWGMVSVLFSPCHLASIPLMVAYVAGQEKAVDPKQAVGYSAAFSVGLFITIACIGVACALLGRMLGDVGNYWQVLVGAILIWVALGMLGVEACSFSGSFLARFAMRGILGAFVLGLAYGFLSGSCTFGFIAPILAIITIQGEIATGIIMILLFATGHCLPWWRGAPRLWCESYSKATPGRGREAGSEKAPAPRLGAWVFISSQTRSLPGNELKTFNRRTS